MKSANHENVYGKNAPKPNKKHLHPEFETEDFAGSVYPLWQAQTESITSLVENKGWELSKALDYYGMNISQYRANLEKLKKNKGGKV